MRVKIYQVDAFTDKLFSGNPAAVCPLDKWLNDETMQNIAAENNLAETAFVVKKDDIFEIRWFTPTVEVDLCGHATLATAFVLFNHENYTGNTIEFYSPRSGSLSVTKNKELLTLNFPSDKFEKIPLPNAVSRCFNLIPVSAFKGRTDYLFVFKDEQEIVNIQPVISEISKLDCRGVIVTSKGNEVDFVSRFFAPQAGVDEDPVTGSAHTTLTPYWSKQLNKIEMSAIQLSKRKGYLQTKYLGDRVEIGGKGKLYLIGEIFTE
jgi:PhzF family phenazine biosynthesis protein